MGTGLHGGQRSPTSVVLDSEVGIRAQGTLKGDTAAVPNLVSVQGPDDLDELQGQEALYGGAAGGREALP